MQNHNEDNNRGETILKLNVRYTRLVMLNRRDAILLSQLKPVYNPVEFVR